MNYKDSSPKLELKLNLSPPRRQVQSPHESISSTEVSPRSSCVSRETSPDGASRYSSSPESSSSMMLVGCPRCLMYVMLLEDDPKCPKCKSTVLLDFMHEERAREFKKISYDGGEELHRYVCQSSEEKQGKPRSSRNRDSDFAALTPQPHQQDYDTPGYDTLLFREPRSAFLSPDRDDDQRSILSTIIRGIQTPFQLQHIHWTLCKFPQESDNAHTLDEIIATRLTDMARQCANDDQFTSMAIHLTKLEKVDEFPEQNNRQLLEQHLGNWIRENPESEARAALKCLEAIIERLSPVKNRYYEVRSMKMGKEAGEMDCSICMRGFKEGKQAIRMPCSHIFHGICILKWLENAPNCPLCRFSLC